MNYTPRNKHTSREKNSSMVKQAKLYTIQFYVKELHIRFWTFLASKMDVFLEFGAEILNMEQSGGVMLSQETGSMFVIILID